MNRALDDFTKAITYDPSNPEAYFNRGVVRCTLALESHNLIKAIITQKAIDDVERVILLAQLDRAGGTDHIPSLTPCCGDCGLTGTKRICS
ncbi:MAG: tetratricopeptide repeat protein [Treponema sp.]|jgi:hypothetical protein|nr:tetratricopeptide repeat protein [Treponema sp.]